MKGALLLVLLLEAAMAALGGWALMLAVGVVHSEWIPQCPTIPFGPAIVVSLLLRAALYSPPSSGSDR